jgi:N-acetylglucosamine-6-phosphate deacetylase
MVIKNANVYTEDGTFIKKDVYIRGDRIADEKAAMKGNGEDTILDVEGMYLIPGLTDLHMHGCVGYDFCDGTSEAIETMADYEAHNGITTICPATMTVDDDTLTRVFASAAAYKSERGAVLVGINMEGPYFSHAKRGAQNPAYLRLPNVEHFRRMQKLSNGMIKLVDVAPELEGAMEFISEVKDEVVISLAHTTADYDTALEAYRIGASHLTHIYNAMPPFSHRSPGVIGAALDSPHCHIEMIVDGIHIDPSVVRATFRMFGDDRIILISDSMMATGLKEGQYSLGGQFVTLTGGKVTLADGTIAGSATNLMKCLQTAVSFGIPFPSAVKCAAVNPAKEIGIYGEYGSITPGKYANLVLLDQEYQVKKVILKGNIL